VNAPANLAAYDKAGADANKQAAFAATFATIQANTSSFGKRDPAAGSDLAPFLGGGGGGHGRGRSPREDHSAQEALRSEQQFQQDMSRSEQDILHAQQDLSTDYVERTTIGIQILNTEKAAYESELAYEVALNKLTKGKEGMTQAEADQLKAAYGIKDGLERQKLLQDEQTQRQEDVEKLIQGDYDRRKDILQSQDSIATTASERRKVELELLAIAYEQKRQALQNTIDTSKDGAAIEQARRDLLNLNQTFGNDRQGVLNSTRGPLEEWAATVPKTAAQITEAIQGIEANGLDGLSSAIADVVTGTKSLGSAFGEVAKSIISDLIQMSVKMLIFRALSSAFGGLFGGSGLGQSIFPVSGGVDPLAPIPGLASGGSIQILGRGGTDRNLLSLNGMPIARVSAGERIDVANDNVNGGGGAVTVMQTFQFEGVAVTKDEFVHGLMMTKAATVSAIQEMRRRS
jgi:hypothetical protein